MRRVFHVDLDAFFVSVELTRRPELRGKPVIVGRRHRGVVASASYEARKYGVRSAMPISRALRLCPQAVIIEPDHSLYRRVSQGFHEILGRFSPLVEPLGMDEAYLDMTGSEPSLGNPLEAAAGIKSEIRDRLGIPASVGIASSKLVAKIASSLAKPDGLLEVPEGQERDFLSPLPVDMLPGVGPRTAKVLRRLGIDTIGDLASLPVSRLRGLLGSQGLVLHYYALGRDDSPVSPPGEARSISRSTTFPRDITEHRLLEAALAYLTEKVGLELRTRGKAAAWVTLKVRYADFETHQLSQKLKTPHDSDGVLFRAARALMERQLSRHPAPVRLLGVGVHGLVPGRQLSFWEETKLENLQATLDRLRREHGFDILRRGLFSLFPGEYNMFYQAQKKGEEDAAASVF